MALVMTPIYTQTASGSAAQINFNNIPQVYTDLLVKVFARDARNQGTNRIRMTFNGDASALYSVTVTGGNAASAFSFRESGSANMAVGLASSATSTASTGGTTEIYIPNYANTSNFKQVVAETCGENNSASSAIEYLNFAAGLYRSTNAITSINLLTEGGPNYSNISTFSLYGIIRSGA